MHDRQPAVLSSQTGRGFPVTHVVFQALDDLDAVVAQIDLFQVDKVLQTLYFSNPITLKVHLK